MRRCSGVMKPYFAPSSRARSYPIFPTFDRYLSRSDELLQRIWLSTDNRKFPSPLQQAYAAKWSQAKVDYCRYDAVRAETATEIEMARAAYMKMRKAALESQINKDLLKYNNDLNRIGKAVDHF